MLRNVEHGFRQVLAVLVFASIAAVTSATAALDAGEVAAAASRQPASATSAPAYTIDAKVIAAGGSTYSGNSCYRLRATIGEPAAGYATSSDYALSAGFRAIAQGNPREDLFFAGFEACP